MRFLALAALLASVHVSCVLGGQIPVVDGVLGGVPTRTLSKRFKEPSSAATTPTPGKLRVVENSGICGSSQFDTCIIAILTVGQKPPQACIKHQVMVICHPLRACGMYTLICENMLHELIYDTERFWFFAARNNPATAPLTLWFNGGVCCLPSHDAGIKAETKRS